MESAHASVRHTLPRPVAHLLGNRQVLRVVLDGLAKVAHAEDVPPPHRVLNVFKPLIASDCLCDGSYGSLYISDCLEWRDLR